MISTAGYRDIIHIARHQRPQHYSIMQEIPWQDRPLVQRRYRKTVPERLIPPTGEPLVPLDTEKVRAAVRELKAEGVESIAVCFLFSYLNQAHEERVRQIINEEYPEAFVSTSSSIFPQFREFERFTTTCINSFVGPGVKTSITNLATALTASGIGAELHIMRSNGGVATAEFAAKQPVTLLLSGPAAGVLGGAWSGALGKERPNLITFDVGGTSADIGLVMPGGLSEASARDTAVAGYPVMVPMIAIHTIGAGGGSIASVDRGGAFRVGPKSAGANPGPACYGKGGTDGTVTDANLVLGRLDPHYFLGGEMPIYPDLAREAISHLAGLQSLSLEEAAEGVLTIINSNRANAIRSRTIQKGHDPRQFSMVAFGGAGPLHAAEVADSLHIPEVIVPPHPGITSATGLLTTDLKYDLIQTEFMFSTNPDLKRLNRDFLDLERQALQQLERDEVKPEQITLTRSADCRYAGQGYELRVEVQSGTLAQSALEEIWERFHFAHQAEYGHAFQDNPIEIVSVRVIGLGEVTKLTNLYTSVHEGGSLEKALVKTAKIPFRVAGELHHYLTSYYERSKLPLAVPVTGPAIIFQNDSTTVVPPGWVALLEQSGNLVLRREEAVSARIEEKKAAPIDLITAQVIGGALEGIAIEIGHKLARMSYSSIIRESEDFGAALLDASGEQLSESRFSTPLQLGPIPGYLRGITQLFAERGAAFHPGDVIIHNSPYHEASHGPDVAFCVPVFYQDKLIGFSITTAHHLDIGALTPGSCGIVDATDAYAEGLQFKALKVYEKGVKNDMLWLMLRDNIRASNLVVGDMEAQIAACRIGAARSIELVARYGLERVLAASEKQIQYSERMLRQEIEKLPDGTYYAEGFLDGFEHHPEPAYRNLKIAVTLTIKGSAVTVDFTGTSPQIDLPPNMPLVGTVDVAIQLVVRSVLLDTAQHDYVPQISGLTRPLTIIAPKGTLCNPNFPAPTIARFGPGNIVADTLLRALAQVAPNNVSAGIGNLKVAAFSGLHTDGQFWVSMDITEGSYGGRSGMDGMDAVDTLKRDRAAIASDLLDAHISLETAKALYNYTNGKKGEHS